MAKKQTEYSVAIRIAGMIDPSYTRAMKNAMNYAKQFSELDGKGKAKEIGIIAAGKGIQLAGKAIKAGADLAVRGMQALYGYMKDSVPMAAEYTSALRQVAKFTDGFKDSQNKLTADAYQFSDQVLGMKSVYNPTELLTIAAQNAKAQIKKDDLFESLNLAQEIGSAFDSDAQTAGGIIRELYSNQGKSLEEIRLLADAVNRVENESNADALAMMQIIASKGSLAEIGGVDQRMLAAAAAALGATNGGISGNPDKIATSLENFVTYLNGAAGRGSKVRAEALGQLGLTPDETAKAMQADSQAFTKTLLDGIMKLPADKRLSVISNVFGKAASGDMAKLAKNSEKFLQYLELAYDTGGATVRDEYLYSMEDPLAKYQTFQNQLQGLQIRMGNALLPGLTNFMDEAFGPLGEVIKEMEDPIAEMGTEFGKTIGILVKDPQVKKAFTDLAKAAPELIRTLLPAIPPLADFVARTVIALTPLTDSVLELLVNGVCMLAPLLGPLAQALGAVLNFFVGNGVGKGIMGLLLPGSSAILGNPIDNFVGAAKDSKANKENKTREALYRDNSDIEDFDEYYKTLKAESRKGESITVTAPPITVTGFQPVVISGAPMGAQPPAQGIVGAPLPKPMLPGSTGPINIQEGGGNATGAVYTKPTTIWGTQIAEREAEGVFPLSYLDKLLSGRENLNGEKFMRPAALWETQTPGREAEGMFLLSRLDELLSGRCGGDNYQFTYAPNYTVGPGTDMRELKKTDEQQQREFERRMDRWMARQKRLRFAH